LGINPDINIAIAERAIAIDIAITPDESWALKISNRDVSIAIALCSSSLLHKFYD
jgi:hypothetical protein